MYAFQVRLRDAEGRAFCAGVLVDKSFVLTTASCALQPSNISVGMGEYGLHRRARYYGENKVTLRGTQAGEPLGVIEGSGPGYRVSQKGV